MSHTNVLSHIKNFILWVHDALEICAMLAMLVSLLGLCIIACVLTLLRNDTTILLVAIYSYVHVDICI